jgi:hypothetical protein
MCYFEIVIWTFEKVQKFVMIIYRTKFSHSTCCLQILVYIKKLHLTYLENGRCTTSSLCAWQVYVKPNFGLPPGIGLPSEKEIKDEP